MDDAKTAADGVEVAKDRTVVEVSEDHDAQADQAQSKEKHESVEKEAGFAAACEVRSAVGKDVSQAPIAVEEARHSAAAGTSQQRGCREFRKPSRSTRQQGVG